MQQDKVKVQLSGVSETLLFCLLGRARLSREYSSFFYDERAIELVEKIDYDFSAAGDVSFEDILFNPPFSVNLALFRLWSFRAKQFDDEIRAYLADHPRASVINLAAGLDTTFYRVDNGLIHWYDLDLPAVIDVRRQLLPEPDRVTYIAKSLFDPSWCKDIQYAEDGVFMVAGGILMWFEEAQVKQLLSMVADNFPNGEMIFNTLATLGDGFGTWINMFPPAQRGAVRAAWMEALKDWWEKAPQDQREKLSGTIVGLKNAQPKGEEWADLESWWNQLSNNEKEAARNDFGASSDTSFGKVPWARWTLEDANELTRWDDRFTVIDQFPLWRDISQHPSLRQMTGNSWTTTTRGGGRVLFTCECDAVQRQHLAC